MQSGHVALVGLMGCGKSTVGALVARRMKMRFVDLDSRIVERFGSIEEIFAREGEAGFRAHEFAILEESLALPVAMISTGGGILTYEPSRGLLSDVTTIYLEVSVEKLVKRLRRSATIRPLIGSVPTIERVSELYEARRHFYEASSYRIDAERDVNVVVANVLRILKQRNAKQSAG